MIILTVLFICFVLVIEFALLMRGNKKDEMDKFFLSHALAEVGFVAVIVSLFSVIFDVIGLLARPANVSIENAQIASLVCNIKYLVICVGTYLIFYFRYQYSIHHSDQEGD